MQHNNNPYDVGLNVIVDCFEQLINNIVELVEVAISAFNDTKQS